MGDRRYVPNHTIDPVTGYIESLGYAHAFDAVKKDEFLEVYRRNGLALYRTCRELSLSPSSIHKHYKIDPVFKEKFDQVEREYTDELEGVSRRNALEPRMVIERIFQLKALRPEKYADVKSLGPTQIVINVDGNTLTQIKKREEIVDAEVVTGSLPTENKSVDKQQD